MEASLGLTNQAFGENEQDNVRAQFFYKPEKNRAKSEEAGYDVYTEEVWVRMMVPGERSMRERPMYVGDETRWPGAWKAFQNDESQEIEGMLLESWPVIDRSMAETFKGLNIHTVEQLAAIPDTECQRIMGGFDFRQKAQDWIETANGNVSVSALQKELHSRDAQIEALTESLADMKAQLDALKPAKGGKGKDKD